MTLKLNVESEAEAELEDAADRYESAVPGLGLDFLAEMRQRTLPPFGGVEGVRCVHAVGRFPHLIVYLALDDAVHVLAYMHPRQRPGYWAHRGPSRA